MSGKIGVDHPATRSRAASPVVRSPESAAGHRSPTPTVAKERTSRRSRGRPRGATRRRPPGSSPSRIRSSPASRARRRRAAGRESRAVDGAAGRRSRRSSSGQPRRGPFPSGPPSCSRMHSWLGDGIGRPCRLGRSAGGPSCPRARRASLRSRMDLLQPVAIPPVGHAVLAPIQCLGRSAPLAPARRASRRVGHEEHAVGSILGSACCRERDEVDGSRSCVDDRPRLARGSTAPLDRNMVASEVDRGLLVRLANRRAVLPRRCSTTQPRWCLRPVVDRSGGIRLEARQIARSCG